MKTLLPLSTYAVSKICVIRYAQIQICFLRTAFYMQLTQYRSDLQKCLPCCGDATRNEKQWRYVFSSCSLWGPPHPINMRNLPRQICSNLFTVYPIHLPANGRLNFDWKAFLYYKFCLLNFLSGREFSQKANLMKHELVHTDVKPHKCMFSFLPSKYHFKF